jgi:hypothetical protein
MWTLILFLRFLLLIQLVAVAMIYSEFEEQMRRDAWSERLAERLRKVSYRILYHIHFAYPSLIPKNLVLLTSSSHLIHHRSWRGRQVELSYHLAVRTWTHSGPTQDAGGDLDPCVR